MHVLLQRPILSAYNSAELVLQDLRALIYPLTQILIGTVRLVPTPRYFPLRLRCIRALLGLQKAAGVYIPIAPLLLEMLQWAELSKTPRAGSEGFPDMQLQLRVSKSTLRLAAFQEEVVNQVRCGCQTCCIVQLLSDFASW